MKGRDVLGLAQTGTGKTAAFVLPILQRLLQRRRRGDTRVLVVAPTRELAAQVHGEFERLAEYTPLRATVVFGGVPLNRQVRALKQRPEIVVACPGRLLDLLSQGALRIDRVETLVLDEADHMFDMGFLPDIRRILKQLPRKRQNLMFSATMPREIRGLADQVLHEPKVVELANARPAETIRHGLFHLGEKQKVQVLDELLSGDEFRSAIVFSRTKRRAKRLAERLDRAGHNAVALQGNMSQGQRERALKGFREGDHDVLVATDIAARGLDIAGVSHVVNFDLPNTPDAYTHRIGRTGRSEESGTAYTFVTPDDQQALRAIEKRLGKRIEVWRAGTGGGQSTDRAPRGPRRAGKSAQERRPRSQKKRSRTSEESASNRKKERPAFGAMPENTGEKPRPSFGAGVQAAPSHPQRRKGSGRRRIVAPGRRPV